MQNYLDDLLKQAGGWGPDLPQGSEFDPMQRGSVLTGWGEQAAKEKNQLNVLFQSAVMAGDLEKASQLAVTPEHKALLNVAYGQKINDQDRRARMDAGRPYDAPVDLVKNYNDQQYTNVLRNQAQQDRMMKIQAAIDASKHTNAQTDLIKAQETNATLKPMVTPPPGYRPTREGNLERIPGGPADVKNEAGYLTDTSAMQSGMADLDRLAGTAKQVLANAHGLKGISGWQGYFPNLRGSDASNAQADLDSLKAMVSFGVLKDMRNTSKTGGALGNVSDAEGKRLEAALGSLANAQSVKQFTSRLNQVIAFTDEAKNRIAGTYNSHYGTKESPTASTPTSVVKGQDTSNTVTLPDGRTKTFPNAAAAAMFKKAAGL